MCVSDSKVYMKFCSGNLHRIELRLKNVKTKVFQTDRFIMKLSKHIQCTLYRTLRVHLCTR